MKELPARARGYLVATWLLAALALVLPSCAHPDWLLIGALAGLTVIIDRARPGLRMQRRTHIGLHMTLPMAVAAGLLGGPAEASLRRLRSPRSPACPARSVQAAVQLRAVRLSAAAAGWILSGLGAPMCAARGQGDFNGLADFVAVLAASVAYCLVNAALLSGDPLVRVRHQPARGRSSGPWRTPRRPTWATGSSGSS